MGQFYEKGREVKKKDILIYNFIDYVEYLSSWFEYQKEHQYGFSYRSFNHRADIKSPNYLQRIIARQRKLSERYLPNLARGLGLDESETEYLKLMVQIDKCRDENMREELIGMLITLRARKCDGVLTKPMLHYLSRWFYPVIRELVVLKQTIDPKELSRHIKPKVLAKDIDTCIKFLIGNDFISKNGKKLKHSSPILTTGDEIESEVVTHFHKETLMLTAEELYNMPLSERDVSSLVLALSNESFKRIKKEIQIFRKKLLQISEEETKADRVYHVGFQLLSRSNFEDDEGVA